MSNAGLVLPPSMQEIWTPTAIPTVDPLPSPEADADDEAKNLALPKPTGWKILCALPKLPDKFGDTEILRPDSYNQQEQIATAVLFVLEVGPLAYKDKDKFGPDLVPWCKKGDFVLVRTYAGTRFKIFGAEMRLINDDEVAAVVSDPRGISRI